MDWGDPKKLSHAEARAYTDYLYKGGVIGHGSFRRMVLEGLLEEGTEMRPGYSLEYCAMTSVDLYGAMFQAAMQNSQLVR